jgi:hypothetical protein
MLGQNSLRNCLGRPDDTAIAAERVEEIVTEPFEQIDVLGFLTRKVQNARTRALFPWRTGRA